MPLRLRELLLDPDDDAGAPAGPDTDDNTPAPEASDDATPAPAGGDGNEPETLEDAVLAQLGVGDDKPDEGSEAGEGDDEKPADPGPGTPGAAAAAADKSGAPKADADADKPKDPDADLSTPPEGLGEKGKERYQLLVDRLKEQRTRADTHERNLEQLVGTIRNTGASPEEFGTALEYMRSIRSDDPQVLARARELLVSELRGIDAKMGRPPESSEEGDALIARHADLKQAVDAMDVTREWALRVAAEREAGQRQQQQRAEHQQRVEQHQEWENKVTQASQAVAEVEAQLRARDPNYARIEQAMSERAAEIATLYRDRPDQWPVLLVKAYQQLRSVVGDAPATPAPGRQAQPLRPGQGGSTVREAPKSMEDAVLQGLGID